MRGGLESICFGGIIGAGEDWFLLIRLFVESALRFRWPTSK